jgi:excisionase family DNA binding protein
MPSTPTPPPVPPLAVPTKEAGRLLSVSLSRLYELLRAGELDSYADGYNRRVTMASIHGYVERRLADNGGRWRQITAQPRRREQTSRATNAQHELQE